MPDAAAFAVFLSATAVLLLTPGPAVIYIAARSIDQGRKAGLVSVLGIAVGTLFHIFAAAFGLSAILMRSATAFNAIRYAGAAYLIYLGIRAFLAPPADPDVVAPRESLARIFRNGIMVNLLNPKTAIFFFAFLPQFVSPDRGSVTTQIVTLGLIFLVLAVLSDAMYALLAGTAAGWLRGRARFGKYVSGTVYVALGLGAALSGGPRKS